MQYAFVLNPIKKEYSQTLTAFNVNKVNAGF